MMILFLTMHQQSNVYESSHSPQIQLPHPPTNVVSFVPLVNPLPTYVQIHQWIDQRQPHDVMVLHHTVQVDYFPWLCPQPEPMFEVPLQ